MIDTTDVSNSYKQNDETVSVEKTSVRGTGFMKMEYRDCENGVQGFMSNTPIYMYILIIHRL